VYSILANSILVIHAAFVAFVILTVPCIYIGKIMNWRWVRLFWLRLLHLVSIGIVVAQSWARVICPLTTLEMWLREKGTLATYTESFVEHWLKTLLYWNLPAGVFIVVYSLFGLLVIATWYFVPPTRGRNSSGISR
jgi:hypothetical protein